jgi:hypothetical protein
MTSRRYQGASPRPASALTSLLLAGLAIAGLAIAGLLAGCGTASHPAAAATRKTCQQVGAVLSDGPDPKSDAVGYAEAQILPLRQVHADSPLLRAVIGRLDRSYQRFFAANGRNPAATAAVATASRQLDAICPGAAP